GGIAQTKREERLVNQSVINSPAGARGGQCGCRVTESPTRGSSGGGQGCVGGTGGTLPVERFNAAAFDPMLARDARGNQPFFGYTESGIGFGCRSATLGFVFPHENRCRESMPAPSTKVKTGSASSCSSPGRSAATQGGCCRID